MASPSRQPRPRLPSMFESWEEALIIKVGTRGVCLLILGFVWSILGFGFTVTRMERFSKPGPGGILDFLDRGVGVYVLSLMWLIGGLAAVIVAIQRPITCRDDIGFNGLALPPFIWGSAYWWSFFLNQLSDGTLGRPNTYIAALIYWSITILVMFLARHLSDHPKGPCARRRDLHGPISQ